MTLEQAVILMMGIIVCGGIALLIVAGITSFVAHAMRPPKR